MNPWVPALRFAAAGMTGIWRLRKGETGPMTYSDILYRAQDGVAVVTLNRPDQLNPWRGGMDRAVRAAKRAAADDPVVRRTVLPAAGRGLSAGPE